MDDEKTIENLKVLVKDFCDQRDWEQFHNAKELTIGISTESNELLQHFRFKTKEQIEELFKSVKFREQCEDELSDVFYFVLRFAQLYDIDLSNSLERKMKKNDEKYPVRFSKGNNRKYNEDDL